MSAPRNSSSCSARSKRIIKCSMTLRASSTAFHPRCSLRTTRRYRVHFASSISSAMTLIGYNSWRRMKSNCSLSLRQNYDQFVELVTHGVELIRAGHASEAREIQAVQAAPLADRLERLTNQLVNKAEADMVAGIETSKRGLRKLAMDCDRFRARQHRARSCPRVHDLLVADRPCQRDRSAAQPSCRRQLHSIASKSSIATNWVRLRPTSTRCLRNSSSAMRSLPSRPTL